MAPPKDLNDYLSRFPMVLWLFALPFYTLVPFGDFNCERTDGPLVSGRMFDEMSNACIGCTLYAVFGFMLLLLVLFLRAHQDA